MATGTASTRLLFRAFVDVPDDVEAERVAGRLASRLRSWADVLSREVGPSWWRPEYKEILLELSPRQSVEEAFARVREALGEGWRGRGAAADRAAEWTPGPRATFAVACIRWAGLEVAIPIEADASVDE